MFRNAFLLCLTASLIFFPFISHADDEAGFPAWRDGFVERAEKAGVSEKTIQKHLLPTKFSATVIKLDRKQPENKLAYREYLNKAISKTKIQRGRAAYAQHRALINKIGAQYKVDPEVIVALWGMETEFGKNCGNIDTLDALATLAYEGRRHQFFEDQLITLLKLIQKGDIHAKDLKGSWAGAMGQTQFMPSSFEKYAVDYNKDGYKDIWHTPSDVFASIANYLATNKWEYQQYSITPASIPVRFDPRLADLKVQKSVGQWESLGVEPKAKDLSKETTATLLALDKEKQEDYVLVFHNFHILLDWNYSRLFAGATLHLASALK